MRKMCGVRHHLSWQGDPLTRPRCIPPVIGASKASSFSYAIKSYRRLITHSVWPLHHQSGSLQAPQHPMALPSGHRAFLPLGTLTISWRPRWEISRSLLWNNPSPNRPPIGCRHLIEAEPRSKGYRAP